MNLILFVFFFDNLIPDFGIVDRDFGMFFRTWNVARENLVVFKTLEAEVLHRPEASQKDQKTKAYLPIIG